MLLDGALCTRVWRTHSECAESTGVPGTALRGSHRGTYNLHDDFRAVGGSEPHFIDEETQLRAGSRGSQLAEPGCEPRPPESRAAPTSARLWPGPRPGAGALGGGCPASRSPFSMCRSVLWGTCQHRKARSRNGGHPSGHRDPCAFPSFGSCAETEHSTQVGTKVSLPETLRRF